MPSTNIDEWSLSMLTGGVPTHFPYSQTTASIFSPDGRYLITTLTHQIRVYFVSTRQCIKTIDIDLNDLVDLKLDVTNPNHAILFKSFGEIVTVNYKDKLSDAIIGKTSIQQQLGNLLLLSVVCVKHNKYIVITGKRDKKKGFSPHTRYINSIDRTSESVSVIGDVPNVLMYSISLDARKLAFVMNDHKVLLLDLATYYTNSEDDQQVATSVSNLESLIVKEVIPFQYRSPVTAIAVSNDSLIALGTNSGVIQVLYGGLVNNDKTQQRVFKWHIDQVNALQFSHDNNYLLSGGVEKVLVFWQLETEKKQFLPRLNGVIDKINIDNYKNDYVELLLKTDVNNYEILVLSLVDLVSRLSVNTIRPKFTNNVKTTLSRTKKRLAKEGLDQFNKLKLRYDYSCQFEIHPKTKNLYFPNESSIQSFDLVKNEQSFIQHAAPVLSTGKVRSETKLLDPQISLLQFTHDGDWMCTYDEVTSAEVDCTLSTNDKQFALKFWKFIENKDKEKDKDKDRDNRNGYWELTTKIIDPHGKSAPVLSLIPAPGSYFNGVAFLTADNKGGVRVWRPAYPKEAYKIANPGNKSQQIAWTLRKQKPSSNTTSDAVALAWSDDSSIIFLSHECSITCFDSRTFDPLEFQLPILTESKIRSIRYLNNYLVVLSKTRFFVYDLIKGQLTNLVTKVSTTSGGKNLTTVDSTRNLICLAVNSYANYESDLENLQINSKLYIFKPDQLKPVSVHNHSSGIASVKSDANGFIFIDLETRVGSLNSTLLSVENNDVAGLTNEINQMLITAQANVDLLNDGNAPVKYQSNGHADEIDDDDASKVIDLHTFQPIFQNLDGIQIETIFDRISNILK
ncbi:Nan1 U3 snoRNP protein [Candida orthopsilosis Co 90-125]|uniref:Nan1 U3 snoRNP protein n=1 Tax=Candida orthopsilosis (strain 90-125) TaxID=1136231 RepID=H8X7G1_CANO9|nr:Nan1 U3 snoRNP protein [Candida orthopsilosis Co 90-125]CCG23745.1 Nan1 U3 snoRNP protein [Candida orthopsilosis Co 90-125]